MNRLIAAICTVAVMLMVACAPAAAPTPTASPTKLPPPVATATSLPVSTSSQESVWTKVIQAAKNEGKLTIYSYNLTGDIGLAVSRSFSQEYGISLDIITGSGSQIVERIITEQRMGQVQADLIDSNALQVSSLKKAGGTIASSEIPALQEKNIWAVDPQLDTVGNTIGYTVSYFTPFVNTNVVKPGEEPKSLTELGQSKWKGKIVMNDPGIDSGPSTDFLLLLRRKATDLDTVRAIGTNDVKFAFNQQDSLRILSSGERAIHVSNYISGYAPAMRAGAPIKAIALKEGTQSRGLAMAAIKGGPHPNAAKLFVNWILSKQGQSVVCNAIGVGSVRKDVPDFSPPQARIEPTKIFVPTEAETEEFNKLFREKYLAKLWGR